MSTNKNNDIIVPLNVKYLNVGFVPNVKYKVREYEDIDGNVYISKTRYIENLYKTNRDFVINMWNKPDNVKHVIKYIFDYLPSKSNLITLTAKEICDKTEYKYENKIHSAIKQLIELNVIRRANTVELGKHKNKHVYVVNHNYIFNGRVELLYKDFKRQKEYYSYKTNELTPDKIPNFGEDDTFD